MKMSCQDDWGNAVVTERLMENRRKERPYTELGPQTPVGKTSTGGFETGGLTL